MEYPRPQLRRAQWQSLDGAWQFAYDDAAQWTQPGDVDFDRQIQVPYAPESQASGIAITDFHPRLWYARRVELGQTPRAGQRVVLHFGAVDYSATVWVNGQQVGRHQGGHAPFQLDVTAAIDGGVFQLALLAEDDPADMHKPRGKQDWLAEPHAIWYPRTTGIWRSVWLEVLNASHVSSLRWTADLNAWQIQLTASVAQPQPGQRLQVHLAIDGKTLSRDDCEVLGGQVARSILLPDPGIDSARDPLSWTPEHPQLIDATLVLVDAQGQVLDTVQSYTAMRDVAVDGNRFMLNARPYTLRMVLDQGYWPKSLMTATSAELKHDVEMIKRLGFNGARKHQKSEDPRWLYWCDVLGLCVWAEMPSAYGFSDATVDRVADEWKALVQRDLSHPCVVAWVPINESWGVPELPRAPRQVDFVQALYHLTRALDGTRPVIGNDGWEMPCGDIVAIHDYTNQPAEFVERYGSAEAVAHSLAHERPCRRKMVIADYDTRNRPVMLTEFGGIALVPHNHEHDQRKAWGYTLASDSADLLDKYRSFIGYVHQCSPLSGFCYTQLTDTFLEQNGLLTEDRQPKADLAELAKITRGAAVAQRIGPDNPFGYHPYWLAKTARQF
ncbi:glycoside hydrolase family 2 protein [Rhodoferax sp.]|uniref:glycoside hydrolase family 2 protein n=1 Tax=Rhodoferax sp. TaxID=50421 RepID=UPI00374CE8C1